MIGLYEYNLLSTDEKAQTLWDKGEFIVSRKSKTNSNNVGQSFTIMENDGKKIVWNGIPEISEGTL